MKTVTNVKLEDYNRLVMHYMEIHEISFGEATKRALTMMMHSYDHKWRLVD